MLGIPQKRGGEILMAKSTEFGQFVKDIIGPDGIRKAAHKIGVSPSYMSSILVGYIPNEDKLAKIAEVYELNEVLTKKLFDLAKETREDIDEETLIQTACVARGLDASQRLAVLDLFRQLTEDSKARQSAA